MTLSSMSSGWDLKFGELNDNADANLFSVVAKALLSKQYKTTTYKFCFFKSILNCTYYTNERCEIAISDLSKEFSSTYWDLINVNKIPQKPESLADNGSSVEILVRKYTEQYPETNSIYLDSYKEALTALLDSPVCFYCGKTHENRRLTLDHVIPWRFLKTDDLWNLVWCCSKCNSSKNDKLPPQEFVDKLIRRNNSLKIQQPDILRISNIALSNGVDEWRINK